MNELIQALDEFLTYRTPGKLEDLIRARKNYKLDTNWTLYPKKAHPSNCQCQACAPSPHAK